MGFLDKAKEFAGKNPDKVQSGIDKAGDMFDEKTGGKHAEHVDKAQDAARKRFGGNNAPEGGHEAPEGEGQPPA